MKWYYDLNRIVRWTLIYFLLFIIFSAGALYLIKVNVTVKAVGLIEPAGYVYVKNKIAGKVKEIKVKDGDYVFTNQVLMQLDDSEALSKLKRAELSLQKAEIDLEYEKANLNKIESEYEMTRKIYGSEKRKNKPYEVIVAEASVKKAEKSLEIASEEYKIAKMNYDDTKIKAPIAGFVYRYDVSELINNEIEAGRILFTIGNTNEWMIQGWVSEKEIVDLKIGQKARVNIKAYPAIRFKPFEGELIEIAGAVKQFEGRGTYLAVKIKLLNSDYKLKPGMVAETEIICEKRRLLSLIFEGIFGK